MSDDTSGTMQEPAFGLTTGQDAETKPETSGAPKEVGGDSSAAAGGGDNASRAPEEESQSQIPGDPRPPHQMQPPTKEQF